MPEFSLRARPPAGTAGRIERTRDPDILSSYLEDAAHFSGGNARELVTPRSEAELAEVVRTARTVLPIGSQSSLTGGATPMGETIVSTRRLSGIEMIGADRVRAGAGVTIEALNRAIEAAGRYYPPSPTFSGACVGGTVATNAAGAATFKYQNDPGLGQRDHRRSSVRGRARHRAWRDPCARRAILVELGAGSIAVPVPDYRIPASPKLSAGYFAAPGMDLINLFIGSEGTLGIVTAVTLRVLPVRPAMCVALVPFQSEAAALQFAGTIRGAARDTWRTCSCRGVDASAIEYLDARSLSIVREDRADQANRVNLPAAAEAALLVTLELPAGTTAGDAFNQIGRARDADRPDVPLVNFCGMLIDAGVFDDVEMAMPGDASQRLAACGAARGSAGRGRSARRPGETRRRRRHREGRRRRRGSVRSHQRIALGFPVRRRKTRARRRRVGTRVGRQPPSECHRAHAGRVGSGARGDRVDRPRGHQSRRGADGGTRRRPQRDQAGTAARTLRSRRRRSDALREAGHDTAWKLAPGVLFPAEAPPLRTSNQHRQPYNREAGQ